MLSNEFSAKINPIAFNSLEEVISNLGITRSNIEVGDANLELTPNINPLFPTIKILSIEDIEYFNNYLKKSKGILPKEFFTTATKFKEFYNPKKNKREKAPQTSKWIINNNNFYDLIDKETGEVYIENVDLKTGLKYVTTEIEPVIDLAPPTELVKEGVLELFESNPELASVGTPEQYSAHLNTIFPKNKIEYRGDSLNLEKFNYSESLTLADDGKTLVNKNKLGSGVYTTPNLKFSEDFAKDNKGKLYTVLVNTKNELKFSSILDFLKAVSLYYNLGNKAPSAKQIDDFTKFQQKNNVSIFVKKAGITDETVSSIENTYILGLPKDIEGFKEFVTQPSTSVNKGTLLNKIGDTIIQSSKTKYKTVNLNGVIEDITKTEKGYNVTLRFKTYNGSKIEQVIIENGNVIKTVYKSPLKMGELIESEKPSYNFEFSKQTTQPFIEPSVEEDFSSMPPC